MMPCLIPKLTLTQENLLKEIIDSKYWHKRLAGPQLVVAKSLSSKGLIERAPGTMVYRLTQRGRHVTRQLPRAAEG